MFQTNDLKRQALQSLITPRSILKQSRINLELRQQSIKIFKNLSCYSLLITDFQTHSSIEIKLENIDYMRLKRDIVENRERQKLIIQSNGRRICMFGEDDEDNVIKEVFEALTVLLDM